MAIQSINRVNWQGCPWPQGSSRTLLIVIGLGLDLGTQALGLDTFIQDFTTASDDDVSVI